MRTHISKALKSRSKAIQRALVAYNQAAALLQNPRPKLTWAQIVEYTTIAEFEILRIGAREDIRNLEWANARNRQASIYHLKLIHAREEITRLNVEVKRLATWIDDEDQQLTQAISKCQDTNPSLVQALVAFMQQRRRVNANLRCTLQKIYALEGYTGATTLASRGGSLSKSSQDGFSDDEHSNEEHDGLIDEMFDGVVGLTIDE
jgi:hypothetical protein